MRLCPTVHLGNEKGARQRPHPLELTRAPSTSSCTVNGSLNHGPSLSIRCIYQEIAGCQFIIDHQPRLLEKNRLRYWAVADLPPLEGNPAELIRAELGTIGEIIVQSDASVGIALSGRLDSSALATHSCRRYPEPWRPSPSNMYEGHSLQDERMMAKELAAHLHMPLHEIIVRTEEMVKFFPSSTIGAMTLSLT